MPLSAQLLLAFSCLAAEPDFVSLFTPIDFRHTGGGYRDEEFHYQLYIPPASVNSTEKWPLIVWLHGHCEAHRDNVAQLKWLDQLIFRPPWNKGEHPFFLLAVQCPRDNPDWVVCLSPAHDQMIKVAAAVLDEVTSRHPIDPDRIYLAGVSSGGTGCWEFGIRQPNRFAAIAPLGSEGADNSRIKRLVRIPIWTFHCSRDTSVPIDGVRRSVDELSSAQGNVHLTQIDSSKHDCWSAAFNNYNLLEWMLLQRRGEESVKPGTVPLLIRLQAMVKGWEWWQVAGQIAIPIVLCAGFFSVVRQLRSGRAQRSNLDAGHPAR